MAPLTASLDRRNVSTYPADIVAIAWPAIKRNWVRISSPQLFNYSSLIFSLHDCKFTRLVCGQCGRIEDGSFVGNVRVPDDCGGNSRLVRQRLARGRRQLDQIHLRRAEDDRARSIGEDRSGSQRIRDRLLADVLERCGSPTQALLVGKWNGTRCHSSIKNNTHAMTHFSENSSWR